RPAEMGEDGFVGATGLFKGIGQQRQVLEVTFAVNRPGHLLHRPAISSEPGRVDDMRPEWIPENLAGEGAGSPVYPTANRFTPLPPLLRSCATCAGVYLRPHGLEKCLLFGSAVYQTPGFQSTIGSIAAWIRRRPRRPGRPFLKAFLITHYLTGSE